MSILVQEASPALIQTERKQTAPKLNGAQKQRVLRYPLPELPKLGWEWGHKLVRDEQSGDIIEAPLTLLDLLYPTGEELVMAEGWLDRWRTMTQDCPFPSEITPEADATTGERLTLPEEWRHLARVEAEARATAEARAEAEAARDAASAVARVAVEAKLAEAMARLQESEARNSSK